MVTINARSRVLGRTHTIEGWMKALKDDKTLFIRAAGQAQKAANLIVGKEIHREVEKLAPPINQEPELTRIGTMATRTPRPKAIEVEM